MDPSLLRERQQFMKKASSIPVVEKRKSSTKLDYQQDHKKQKHSGSKLNKNVNKSSTKYHNFGLLANILQHLREKYLEGNQSPLTLEQILHEINQSDIDPIVQWWLGNDSLKGNPKIQVIKGKFLFKPIYKLTDRMSLLNLLKLHDVKGLGGVLWEDVVESLPNAEHILKTLIEHNRVKIVIRSFDKKKILFRMDPTANLDIDMDFKTMWNTIDVEAIDHKEICDYLNNQTLTFMKAEGFKKPPTGKNNQKNGKRKGRKKERKENGYLEGILKTYDSDESEI